MSIKIGYTTNQNTDEAVKELKNQINIVDPHLVIYFASASYNHQEIAKKINEAFNPSDVISCSTAGEIISGKMLNNSIVAMSFDREKIGDVKVEIIENLKKNSDPQEALDNFGKYYDISVGEMDFTKFFGLVLTDGLSGSEEKLMERIGTKTHINFIGGSAGDDLKFEKTFVSANGKTYTDAAVIALVKPNTEFDFLKTQSFSVLDKCFTATKVNEEKREILELDGKQAVEAYARALDKPTDEVSSEFMTYPLGVMIGDEPFVRSPQQVSEDGIMFYYNVVEGTELTLLKSANIVKDTKAALIKKRRRVWQNILLNKL